MIKKLSNTHALADGYIDHWELCTSPPLNPIKILLSILVVKWLSDG